MECHDWQLPFRFLKESDRTRVYEQLVAVFNERLDARMEESDLDDRADRDYLDAVINQVETQIGDLMVEAIPKTFAPIKTELPQVKSSLEQVRLEFSNQADLIRSQLLEIRESLVQETRSDRSHSENSLEAPVDVVARGIGAGYFRYPVFRSPRKKRVPPFRPTKRGLWSVIGKELDPGVLI
jgi:hypothetical protein